MGWAEHERQKYSRAERMVEASISKGLDGRGLTDALSSFEIFGGEDKYSSLIQAPQRGYAQQTHANEAAKVFGLTPGNSAIVKAHKGLHIRDWVAVFNRHLEDFFGAFQS